MVFTMKDLKDCNLLIVSERYPHARDPISSSFVKNQIECIKKYVKKVYVISMTPYVPRFLSRFEFMDCKGRWDGYVEDYKYDNVEVYFAKTLAMPFDFSRRRRGDDGLANARRIIEKNKLHFDLIHAHFTYSAGYVGARLKESTGKPLVLTVHEDRNWLRNEMASKDEKLLFTWHSCDRIIRVSRADIDKFKSMNIDPARIAYIPNGFSSSQFNSISKEEARRKLHIPEDKFVLLNLAALEAYKGQEHLVRAMKIVAETRKDAVLYIVGKGSLKNHLQSLIDEFDLQETIILAGGDKPSEEITLWMNSCDIFVLSSISEGNPTVMFEALGCGKPFIGTKVGGIPEIIADDRLGILVEPKDNLALAKSITSALARDWNNNYIREYSRQFTWDRIAEMILDQYHGVLYG